MNNNQLKRPSYWSSEVAEQVVEKIMPDILKYIGESPELEDEQYLNDTREDLLQAIDFEDDEYRICRSLERSTWEVDSQLYDIMGKVAPWRMKLHDIQIKEWVKQHSIKLEYSVGQRVSLKTNKGVTVEGEITDLNHERATYTVYCESEGHVKTGVGTHGYVLPAEDVKLVSEERRTNFSQVSPGVGCRENDV